MLKTTRCLVAAALTASAISAFAQDTANKTDVFGQPVTGLGAGSAAPTAPEAPRRVNINHANNANNANNASNVDGNTTAISATPALPVSPASPTLSAQQQRQAANRVTSEFQKFVADSSGVLLPIFGAEFFANAPTTVTPISGAP
ncbi:MAG: hypothetical protein H7232_14935, partial [Aeromicrobium sp.]|nr:hypothetical protein [Burkholderiales bacterium]